MRGQAKLLWTETIEREIADAPNRVQAVFLEVPFRNTEKINLGLELVGLAQAYLDARIVSLKWYDDCLHVAAATLAGADAIVSWNFRHIVRLDRIRAFNSVNSAEGYGSITILSPKEVIFGE